MFQPLNQEKKSYYWGKNPFINPILHGLLEVHNSMGEIKTIPPIKIHQNDSNLVKRHVLAKTDYFCPLFMHLELNY